MPDLTQHTVQENAHSAQRVLGRVRGGRGLCIQSQLLRTPDVLAVDEAGG